MNLSEQDDVLNASFEEFTAAAGPSVRPAGADAVRVTVARRRRALALTIAALAAVAIAIPLSTYAALGRSAHGPPVSPATAGPSVVPTTEPTVEPTTEPANPGPSPVPAEGEPCAQRPTTPPRDFVSVEELCAAQLALPQWQNPICPTQLTLQTGALFIADSVHLSLSTVVHADVDRDGAFETVALLNCGGEVRDQQVVAFRPGRTGGVETVAQVLANGNLRITVGDYGVLVGTDPTINQLQDRTYRWNGERFVQVAGPTSFPPNPRLADLTLTAPALAFRAPSGSTRTANITLTARNLGPAAVPIEVVLQIPSFVDMVTGPDGCGIKEYPSVDHEVRCNLPDLASGSSRQLSFTFVAPANADALTSEYVPTVAIGIPEGFRAPMSPGGFDDPVPENNGRELTITYA